MTIQEGLAMDHLYVCLNDLEFETLKAWLLPFPGVAHEVVHSGDDQWEGLYVSTRIASYFEFARENHLRQLGIAVSARGPQYMDGRKLADEMPHLPWKKGQRVDAQGQPWFDYLSLGDYTDTSGKTAFNAWLMHYHHRHTTPTKRAPFPFVDSFATLHVLAGEEMRQEIENLGSWLPARIVDTKDERWIYLQDRDRGEMAIRITFKGSGRVIRLKSLKWRLSRGMTVAGAPASPWRLDVRGDEVELSLDHAAIA